MSDQHVFFLSVCYSLGSPAEHLHQISIYHTFQSVAFNFECLFWYRSWKNCDYIYTFINKHNPPPERIIPKAKWKGVRLDWRDAAPSFSFPSLSFLPCLTMASTPIIPLTQSIPLNWCGRSNSQILLFANLNYTFPIHSKLALPTWYSHSVVCKSPYLSRDSLCNQGP